VNTPTGRISIVCLFLLILCLSTSCMARQDSPGSGMTSASTEAPVYGQSQELPFVQATLASRPVRLMLAKTAQQQMYGLMFRTALGADEGMLFCYDTPRQMSFWMKNTILPLDLIFFDADLRITEFIKGMKPGIGVRDILLPRYTSALPAQYALELASGTIDAWSLRPGERLEIPLPLLGTE